ADPKNPLRHDPDAIGMKIRQLSDDKSLLICLKLLASRFISFVCYKSKIIIMIDTCKLYTLLKFLSSNQQITLFMNKNNPKTLCIEQNNKIFQIDLIKKSHRIAVIQPSIQFLCIVKINSRKWRK